jgi:glyoxylase-like metal-dependent hydrolase (beta-lactamase superfamily II)
VVVDPPDHTLTIAADVDVGGRLVELRYLGRGHTDGDIVVRVPDADVLFAGDLLENGATPWFGDGYPIDWPATVDRLRSLATGVVVPGHGAESDRSLVERQLAEFRLVAALARRVHDGRLIALPPLSSMPYPPVDAEEP